MEKARALAPFPYRALRRPLDAGTRTRLSAHLRGLLDWQRDLRRWPSLRAAPEATPFVSLYARERLVGCFGSDEGAPTERVSRAFLRALGDTRHHPLAATDRPTLLGHLAYPIAPFRLDPDRDAERIEAGTHGLVRLADTVSVLLPSVARDGGHDAERLLEALADKAGVSRAQLGDGVVYAFSTETICALPPTREDPAMLARRWLARLVQRDGAVRFAVDARRRAHIDVGAMHHGRSAIVVAAIARSHGAIARRARARLEADARAALRGRTIAGWPEAPAQVAGTLALLLLAGALDDAPLVAYLDAHREVARDPWHAAQCVAALGPRAPAWLWTACARDLERRPWAPWTLLAARARDDARVVERSAPPIAGSIGPRGGATVTAIPELALTALCVEALAGLRDRAARDAVARGRDFLRRWQLRPDTLLGAHDPELALGAFPGSPVADTLRGDITGHAVLALDG